MDSAETETAWTTVTFPSNTSHKSLSTELLAPYQSIQIT